MSRGSQPAERVQERLETLLDISSVARVPEHPEDVAFLVDQRSAHRMSIGPRDEATTQRWQRWKLASRLTPPHPKRETRTGPAVFGPVVAVFSCLFFPPPLAGRSRSTLEGPVSGPQDRNDVVASHVFWAGRNGAQLSESGPHHGRTAQQHVLWGVCFFPADRAEGCGAVLVLTPVTSSGGGLSDLVSPLGRAGPVADPQLVDVDCRLLPPTTGRGRREPISRRYHPAGQARRERLVWLAIVSPPSER